MNDVIKRLCEKIKSPKILLVIGLAGILLIFVSSLGTGEREKQKSSREDGSFSATEYKEELEENITELVKSIAGGKPRVVITLESGVRYSYADIKESATEDKTDTDGVSTENEQKQSYITVKTSDGGEEALLVTTEMPEIRGVAVICRGGDNETINEKITNAVTAALNITSKRVYVGGISDEKG